MQKPVLLDLDVIAEGFPAWRLWVKVLGNKAIAHCTTGFGGKHLAFEGSVSAGQWVFTGIGENRDRFTADSFFNKLKYRWVQGSQDIEGDLLEH